jgi:TonB family protein
MNHFSIYDELDQEIERMIATPVTIESEPGAHLDTRAAEQSSFNGMRQSLAELVEVARDLRRLPRPDFKTRLRVELEWQAAGRTFSSQQCAEVISGEDALLPSEGRVFPPESDALPTLFGKNTGLYPVRSINLAASVALHAALLLFAGLGVLMVKSTAVVPEQRVAGVTWLDAYVFKTGSKPKGGGGGGEAEKTNASQGQTVRFTPEQLAPPTIEASPSRLPVEATLVGPPDVNLVNGPTGNPLSILVTPSGGTGISGGIGSGSRGGVGGDNGPGRGPGTGGSEGGSIYLPGSGATAPRAIFSPEPEYSDEARAAKYQGVVTLTAIVGPDGRPRHVRVARALGMGLDEKAVAAVQTWRFEPGMKDDRPVNVQITVEVYFHLF